jgi:secernin
MTPPGAIFRSDVCMHAGFGPARGSQSVGSLVASLRPGQSTFWVTGTSAPCTGLFKPVWMDAGLPDVGSTPGGEYDPKAGYWRHEVLHREVIRNYKMRMMTYQNERDQMEAVFIREADGLISKSSETRRSFSTNCFQMEEQSTPGWVEKVTDQPASRLPFYFMNTWRKFDIQAKMPNP